MALTLLGPGPERVTTMVYVLVISLFVSQNDARDHGDITNRTRGRASVYVKGESRLRGDKEKTALLDGLNATLKLAKAE